MNIVKTSDPLPVPVAHGGVFADLQQKLAVCETLAKARLVPDAFRGSPGDILIALQMAEDLGISAMAALNGINIIKGKAGISAEMMRSLTLNAGHRFRVIESTGERCTVEITRADDKEHPQSFTFTISDAAQAGLTASPMYAKYPAEMLMARATTKAVRAAAPDVLLGMSSTEELGEWPTTIATDGDGERARDGASPATTVQPDVVEPPIPSAAPEIPDAEVVEKKPPRKRIPVTDEPEIVSSELLRERAKVKPVTPATRGQFGAIKNRASWPKVANWMTDQGYTMASLTEDQALAVIAQSDKLTSAADLAAEDADTDPLDGIDSLKK
jgi:hypothetical protein